MTDLLSAAWLLIFGSASVVFLLALVRDLRNGERTSAELLHANFAVREWCKGDVAKQDRSSSLALSEGMRMSVTGDQIKIVPTRTISREVV